MRRKLFTLHIVKYNILIFIQAQVELIFFCGAMPSRIKYVNVHITHS